MKAPFCAAILAASFAVPAITASADDAVTTASPLDPVIVTATRTPTPAVETLAAVTVISRDEIERAQTTDIAELLRYTAGIDIGRSGGPGTQTSVFIRGAESNQTLVLVDGIRINPNSIGGAAVQNIAPEMIERIEIVKGPRATLYGSDGIGGVINIITRSGGNGADVSARAGSYNTREITGNASYSDKGNTLSLYAQNSSTDGIPVCDNGGPDRGYKQTTFDAKGSTNAGPVKLSARIWNVQGNAQYMDYCGAGNSPLSQDFRNQVLEGEAAFKPVAMWDSTFSISRMIDDIQQLDANFLGDKDFVRTSRPQLDWHNILTLNSADRLSFGMTAARDEVQALSFGLPIDNNESQITGFVQNEFSLGKHHTTVGGGYGHYGSFGDHASWNAEYGYDLFKATRLIASAGSGFRAPKADERFGFGGNPNLKPEEARNYEVGLKQGIGESQLVDLRLFRRDVTNQIFAPGPLFVETNIYHTRTQGAELSYQLAVDEWTANITGILQNPVNKDTNTVLLRRAKRSATAQLARHFGKHYLGLDVLTSGPRVDAGGNDGGYTLLALSGGLQLDDHFSLQGRLDNVLNKKYETAFGYNQPGTNGYVSLRYAF
jgi:vitamin B12 transporter